MDYTQAGHFPHASSNAMQADMATYLSELFNTATPAAVTTLFLHVPLVLVETPLVARPVGGPR